jgi:hypothetical protein
MNGKTKGAALRMTRREALVAATLPLLGLGATLNAGSREVRRRYHVCLSPDAIEPDPGLLGVVHKSGVSDVWTAGFLYGHWYYTPERIQASLERIRRAGMAAHVVNVPLGHPGDSLGAPSASMPLLPPAHWRPGTRIDGRTRWGTSLHPPATEENAAAVRRLEQMGVDRVFLDDDFRIAESPGTIGGCFCAEHLEEFRKLHGYGQDMREGLIQSIKGRQLTPVVRNWVDFWCDHLGACFHAQQSAAPHLQLGIMVMYLGAEKAGIRLADYSQVPLRVGELMFSDAQFRPVKGKTDELFSVLFHRRFVSPELAFSETTAFPADKLSASNMPAKLATSTIADVRNTMFMSGITPFPRSHWATLAPAMKKHAAIHRQLAGHKPYGPFKHFWGEHSRYVGDDHPYSLFLATGVPFEVTSEPSSDGWTFLSDADAGGLDGARIPSPGTVFVSRLKAAGARQVTESMDDLFKLKAEILPKLRQFPIVLDEKPVVCAWYPTARLALLWNLSEQREAFTLECAGKRRHVKVGPLDVELVRNLGPSPS